jgi:hypothetical protein
MLFALCFLNLVLLVVDMANNVMDEMDKDLEGY